MGVPTATRFTLSWNGLYVWLATSTTAFIVLLDLTSKVIYGFLAMSGSKTIADADLARGEVSPDMISTHAGAERHAGSR